MRKKETISTQAVQEGGGGGGGGGKEQEKEDKEVSTNPREEVEDE